MIENEQQYQITKDALTRFEEALAHCSVEQEDRHPLLQRAFQDGITSEIEILRGQLAEYERVSSGLYAVIELDSLLDLPVLLIRARHDSAGARRTPWGR